MIDDGEPGTWAEAMLPDRRSLQLLSNRELHGPHIIDQIARWHGVTPDIARDMKGAECLRRKTTNKYGANGHGK